MHLKASRYIQEIDSLRALAVIAVILNHLDEKILPSGFLGVDIFFAISGFVVTKSIMDKPLKKTGFVRGFYLSRLKRLYPALLFCILISIALGSLFVLPKFFSKSLETASYSLVALANIFLINSSLDYFSLPTSLNLFTHTWSLSLEEQFYIFFPLLYKFTGIKVDHAKTFFSFLLLLTIVSLFSYIYYSASDQVFAYYSPYTRFWQISLGAITYFIASKIGVLKKESNFCVKLSFAILVLLLVLPKETHFYSRFAVTLTTCVFLFNVAYGDFSKEWILNEKLPVFLGKISYSLYLWHWPLIAIIKNTVGVNLLSSIVFLIFLSTMSLISYYFIENKFRYKSSILLHTALIASLLIIPCFLYSSKSLPIFGYIGEKAAGFSDEKNWDFGYCSTFRLATTEHLQEKDYSKCFVGTQFPGKRTIYVYGDSYAQQIVSALSEVNISTKVNFNVFSASGCPIAFGYTKESPRFVCKTFFDNYLNFVSNNIKSGDSVLIASAYGYYFEQNNLYSQSGDITAREGKKLHIQRLVLLANEVEKKGGRLFVLGSIPILSIPDPNLCYQSWSYLRHDCSAKTFFDDIKNSQYLKFDSLIEKTINGKANFIHIYPYLRIQTESNVFNKFYYNSTHVSTEGARLLSEEIVRGLRI